MILKNKLIQRFFNIAKISHAGHFLGMRSKVPVTDVRFEFWNWNQVWSHPVFFSESITSLSYLIRKQDGEFTAIYRKVEQQDLIINVIFS